MGEPHLALVVEDDPDLREALRELLLLAGYRVLAVNNGKEALDLMEMAEELPEVILLDLLMPIMNGWQFRRHQLKDARLSTIPVVVLTGGMFAEEAAESIRASAWLAKPVNVDSMLAVLAVVVGAARL
jgi:CheY-like chemotaxis protein